MNKIKIHSSPPVLPSASSPSCLDKHSVRYARAYLPTCLRAGPRVWPMHARMHVPLRVCVGAALLCVSADRYHGQRVVEESILRGASAARAACLDVGGGPKGARLSRRDLASANRSRLFRGWRGWECMHRGSGMLCLWIRPTRACTLFVGVEICSFFFFLVQFGVLKCTPKKYIIILLSCMNSVLCIRCSSTLWRKYSLVELELDVWLGTPYTSELSQQGRWLRPIQSILSTFITYVFFSFKGNSIGRWTNLPWFSLVERNISYYISNATRMTNLFLDLATIDRGHMSHF